MNTLTKIIVISFVGFVVAASLVFFLARPILEQISVLHETQAKQQGELAQLNEQLQAYDQAKVQLKQVNYTEAIDKSIVIREDLAEVLAEVEADAAKTNVTESIRITDDQASGATKTKSLIPGEKTVSEVPYSMNFSGGFTDVLEFMQYMEHLSHFTEISGISMNAVLEKSTDNETVHAEGVVGTLSGVFIIKKVK